MSQSPITENASPDSMLKYQLGWRALNRLLHTDRSFSGGEKNCAFLNLGNAEFATVSSVTGLDYADDGRAVAACDWDFDGRLDLWFTARTAPRVRFVRNQSGGTHHFVSVFLKGDGQNTNRDAIGARVELHRQGQVKLLRTRHAGDGFLTQSTGWLHFGLGSESDVERISVRWPGGQLEDFSDVTADSFLILEQGTGRAQVWDPPAHRSGLIPSEQVVAKTEEVARIVLPYRLPLPRVQIQSREADESPDAEYLQITQPTLINVWSATCTRCVQELHEWSQEYDRLSERGVAVYALSADADMKAAEAIVEHIKPPYAWGMAAGNAIANLDLFQRAVLDRWQNMPVPCSFLVDGNGDVAVIYKGPVSLAQVNLDLELLSASVDRRLAKSTPFDGRWVKTPPIANPLRVSSQFVDHSQVEEAIAYLQSSIVREENTMPPQQFADTCYVLALLLDSQKSVAAATETLERGRDAAPQDVRIRSELGRLYAKVKRLPDAEREFAAALQINPEQNEVRRDYGICLLQQGKARAAATQFVQLVKRRPDDALALFHLATALRKMKRWDRAILVYGKALQKQPDFVLAANNLAWLLSTHHDEKLRDGPLAVKTATAMCQQTRFRDPDLLDTLAAAYAENGQFEQAVETIDRALQIVGSKSGRRLDLLNARRRLYSSGRPLRDDETRAASENDAESRASGD